MKKYSILLFCCLLTVLSFGQSEKATPTVKTSVPAYRGVIERIQPNGDTLHIYLRGDEHQHYTMTTDGWQIVENKKGVLCYALHSKDSTIVASRKQAYNKEKRSRCEMHWLQRKGIQKMLSTD